MKNCLIIGASGYSGAQLTQLILQHPNLNIEALLVSKSSALYHQSFASVYPQYAYSQPQSDLIFQSLEDFGLTSTLSHITQSTAEAATTLPEIKPEEKGWQNSKLSNIDVAFLATPHEVSAGLAQQLLDQGIQVIDLSGAFRLKQASTFAEYYGFEHPNTALLAKAIYGLPEVNRHLLLGANLIAVAGCYPTAAILSLMPLMDPTSALAGHVSGKPIINAISGVSGAGRKASLTNSFCEVSLQAYGLNGHRHLPEIEQILEQSVIFTPHLGQYKRGIYSTITVPFDSALSQLELSNIFNDYYAESPLVQLTENAPALSDVQHTPMVKMFAKANANNGCLQIFTVIDNLLKGAAVNAVQCFNLSHGYPETAGILSDTHASTLSKFSAQSRSFNVAATHSMGGA